MPAQSVNFRFTKRYEAKAKAFKRLPKIVDRVLVDNAKQCAASMVFNFQEGIRLNSFRLRPLQSGTVDRKEALEMERPRSPLYGLGLDHPDSLINALRVTTIEREGRRTSVRVSPSEHKHHPPVRRGESRRRRARRGEKTITLAKLLHIHEYGAFIKRGKGIIVLPPRPAVRLAWERTLKQIRARKTGEKLRAALLEAINYSKDERLKNMVRFTSRERKILDARD